MMYVEKCLYDYLANIAALEYLQEELINLKSIHGHSYEINKPSVGSDPVINTVNNRMELEKKISKLGKKINPIKRLIDDLESREHLKKILLLKYISHGKNDYVQKEMNMSSATYWRRVRELLRIAKKYFGNEE